MYGSELVEGTARIIEARLKREVAEGKIVDFWRTDRGYELVRLEALNGRENKVCWGWEGILSDMPLLLPLVLNFLTEQALPHAWNCAGLPEPEE